CGQCTHLPYSF
nr:immunoglobulin light chain junction region [Macaca mulatta]